MAKGDIPPARSGCSITAFESFFLMFGGYTRKNGDYFNDLYSFAIDSSTWYFPSYIYSYIYIFYLEMSTGV